MLKNIYYINLEERTDRRENIEKELKKIGWYEYERFEAIRGEKGGIGCSRSHLKILEKARELELEYVVILEDDIEFTEERLFKYMLDDFFSRDIEFDVLLLAGNIQKELENYDEYIYKCKNVRTTTGYIVRKHYYDILIDNFREGIEKFIKEPDKDYKYAVDTYWDLLQERDRWYIFIPRLVYQKPGFSDICNREIDYTKWMLDKIEKIDENGDKIEVDYIGNIILYFEGGKSKEIKGKFYVKRNTL